MNLGCDTKKINMYPKQIQGFWFLDASDFNKIPNLAIYEFQA
jgi:hypothetical protein